MTWHKVSETDISDLKHIADYLATNHHIELNKGRDEDNVISVKGSSLKKLGVLIGYKSKNVYHIVKEGKLSDRHLNMLSQSYNAISQIQYKNTLSPERIRKDAQIISQANAVIERILRSQEGQKSVTGLDVFKASKWWVYERFMDAIGMKIIEFFDPENDTIRVRVDTMQEETKPWHGEAYLDSSGDFLIINTYNEGGKLNRTLPTTYMLRIDRNENEIDLCIGHMMFINRINRNVVTKTVILHRLSNIEAVPLEIKLVNKQKIKEFVPEQISRFFSWRNQNRLTSPHSIVITSLKLLEKWHKQNDEVKRNEQYGDTIIGKYNICYKKSNTPKAKLTLDPLEIKDDGEGNITADYKHTFSNGETREWKGSVMYSQTTGALFIELQRPQLASVSVPDVNTIYLILNMPTRGKDFQVLTGVISGIRDSADKSIGLLTAVTKTEKLDEKQEKSINAFFNRFLDRSLVLPPKDEVSNYNQLDTVQPDNS